VQRDSDLIRKLLFAIEAGADSHRFYINGQPYVPSHLVGVDGYPSNELAYHLTLLTESPWTNAIDMTTCDKSHFLIRLTHEGREFLDLARDDARWEAAKQAVREMTGTCDLVFLEAVLRKQAANMIAAIP
jgi:Hypothetical protein (DUF2513)